jgi:hypothetical protein
MRYAPLNPPASTIVVSESSTNLLALGGINTRVRDVAALLNSDTLGDPTTVFVENDILAIFDKLE